MAMLLAGGGVVSAAEEEFIEVTEASLALPASTTTSSAVDQECASSMTKADPEVTTTEVNNRCLTVSELTVSKSEEIALPTGSVWSRLWSQSKSKGGVWKERHTGKFYYDGTRVWSTTSYRGFKGHHTCDQGYGYGVTIEVTKCAVYGGVNTERIQIWDYYKVYGLFKGFPISETHNMHMNVYPSGRAYSHWED